MDLHLTKLGVQVELFTYQWLLTLFSFDFGLTFFTVFLHLLILSGPKFIVQLSLSLFEQIK
jgi:hypothetical protein